MWIPGGRDSDKKIIEHLHHIKCEVELIECKLDHKDFGLEEIKRELRAIESKLDSGDFGLEEIKRELKAIEDKLDSGDCGLEEIKRELRAIEDKLDQLVPPTAGALTTGPVVADNTASSLVVKVLNNTNTTQTITVTVYDIGTCPNPKAVFATTALTVQPLCAQAFIFPKPPDEYEVEFSGMAPGIYAWTATRNQAQAAPLSSSGFVAANTFRHSELVPVVPTPT